MEHRDELIDGFTKKYKCHYLVYYEEFNQVEEAIAREKTLKGWSRAKKEALIREMNPILKDLAIDLNWIEGDSSLRSE